MERVKLLIILIFLSFNGLSNDCSQALGGKPAYFNGRVYSKERKLLEDMANIDQGTFGICYAHSAAFLYDYYRFSVQGQKLDSISSPFEAALSTREAASFEDSQSNNNGIYTYHSKVGEKFENRGRILMSDFEGGPPDNSLEYLIANGGCDHFVIDQSKHLVLTGKQKPEFIIGTIDRSLDYPLLYQLRSLTVQGFTEILLEQDALNRQK